MNQSTEEYVLSAVKRIKVGATVILWPFNSLEEIDDLLLDLVTTFQYDQENTTITVDKKEFLIDLRINQDNSGFIVLKPLSKIDKVVKSSTCTGMADPLTGFCTMCGKIHRIVDETRQQRLSLEEHKAKWIEGLEKMGIPLVKAPSMLAQHTQAVQDDLADN